MSDRIEDLPAAWENSARLARMCAGDGNAEMHGVVLAKAEALEALARELREALRWIPVSERLPTEKGDYLVADCTSEPFVIAVNWFNPDPDGLGTFGSYVTHWRPLPKGPTP